jgi:ribokinase
MVDRPSTGSVLVAGSINTDLVATVQRAPAAGETITGERFDIFGGGKGSNQAFAAVRSGAGTAMLGAVGQDDFGTARLNDLDREGIDRASVAVAGDVASGVALIFVETGGENRIAYVPGSTLTVTADQAVEAFRRVQPAVVLATLELPAEAIQALIDEAKAAGVPVLINATPEPGPGCHLAVQADVLIVNETEAWELLDIETGSVDWPAIAEGLRALGPPAVVITLGAAGALLLADNAPVTVASPQVSVVDTTGAGDAFCGAMAAKIAGGSSLTEALRIGVMAGAVAVTKAGAQPSMPALAEIEQMLSATTSATSLDQASAASN